MQKNKIAIIGAGNMGLALANGLLASKRYQAQEIILSDKNHSTLQMLNEKGFVAIDNNQEAVKDAKIIVLAILPQHLESVLTQIMPVLDEREHILISFVAGVTCANIKASLKKNLTVVRAMPNTAIRIGTSMTCIATDSASQEIMQIVKEIFDTVGTTIEIAENLMPAAMALCSCGIAFYMRAIRAATEAGVELGFHSHEALEMTLQTIKGAAELLQKNHSHPEVEIDKVTSPGGYTIQGLNELDHNGFGSALIKAIKTASSKNHKL